MAVNNIWKRLILLGVKGDLTHTLHIKLTNISNCVHLLLTFILTLFLYTKSLPLEGFICLLFCAGYILVFVLNSFNRYSAASYLFIILSYASVFIYTFMFGVNIGSHFMFLLLMVLCFLIFNISQYWHLYISFIASFTLFFLFHFGIIPSGIHAMSIDTHSLSIITVLCSFVLIGNYCISYVSQFNIVQRAYSKANNLFSREMQEIKNILRKSNIFYSSEISTPTIINKMSHSVDLGKRIIQQEQKSLEKLIITKSKIEDKVNTESEIDFKSLLKHNYLIYAPKLDTVSQSNIRELMEYFENNGDTLNKFIGNCMFSIIDDLLILNIRLSGSYANTDIMSTLLSIHNSMHFFSPNLVKSQIKNLQKLLGEATSYEEKLKGFDDLKKCIFDFISILYPDFNTKNITGSIETNLTDTPIQNIDNQNDIDYNLTKTFSTRVSPGEDKSNAGYGQQFHVLVAEDDLSIAKIIEFRLKKEGIDVKYCKDGKAAVDYLYNHRFDLIITDLMMPFYNGLEIISIVRDKLKLNTPIIVLSAVEEENTVVEALNIGANDFITKPFSTNELSSRVKKYLS